MPKAACSCARCGWCFRRLGFHLNSSETRIYTYEVRASVTKKGLSIKWREWKDEGPSERNPRHALRKWSPSYVLCVDPETKANPSQQAKHQEASISANKVHSLSLVQGAKLSCLCQGLTLVYISGTQGLGLHGEHADPSAPHGLRWTHRMQI